MRNAFEWPFRFTSHLLMLYELHFEQRYTIAWRCGNQILFSNEKDIIMEGCYVALIKKESLVFSEL